MARLVTCVLILLLLSPTATNAWFLEVVGAVAGVILAPAALPILCFTSAGIASGSLAATAMSVTLTTGAVGAAGLAGTVAGAAVEAGVRHAISKAFSEDD
ncbi:unnamed protein product [Lymnaea stagnalis]|uniref:Uncharacterized protein n=1 Tax=Lymnaea stagnalis TaxID=6523 RepID=A0AAV2HS33_LYMST